MIGQSSSTQQEEAILPVNPYVFGRPLEKRDGWVLRSEIQKTVIETLGRAPASVLMVTGKQGSGKTTFLNQLAEIFQKSGYLPIYINIGRIRQSSESEFLWGISKAIITGCSRAGIPLPVFEKRMLTLHAWQSFRRQLWADLQSVATFQPIILLLDDLHSLVGDPQNVAQQLLLRQYLANLIEGHEAISAIYTVNESKTVRTPYNLQPIRSSSSVKLQAFSDSETWLQLTRPGGMVFESYVAKAIQTITAGNPADTQRLAYALFQHLSERGLRRVTLVEVFATLRFELKPTDFYGRVYERMAHISISLPRRNT